MYGCTGTLLESVMDGYSADGVRVEWVSIIATMHGICNTRKWQNYLRKDLNCLMTMVQYSNIDENDELYCQCHLCPQSIYDVTLHSYYIVTVT